MSSIFKTEVADRSFTIEVGKLAGLARSSATLRYGDTVVLVTVCVSPKPREGADFLPLTIDVEERLYAAGKIPGSFFRREGRPSTDAILVDRMTDRPIRSLIAKDFRHEIQVVVTVLSTDQENDPDILSIVGASVVLSTSGVPFRGPVGATRLGYADGQFIINPTYAQLKSSSLDLMVVGTRDSVVMLEAGGHQVSEKIVLEAIRTGQEVNQELIRLQEQVIASSVKPPIEYAKGEHKAGLPELSGLIPPDRLWDALYEEKKLGREEALGELESELLQRAGDGVSAADASKALDARVREEVRRNILEKGLRVGGRGLRDIRPITCEVGLLPRTHGSGLFTRGQTQVLAIATLGSIGEVQRLDTISPEESKRFMHHYNFPAFSTGEVRRIGSPGRREIGHGALAEKALLPVIPDEEQFPYTIRLVSEVLSSNGSTSMASVCGSSLSLMDAGVPISAPVAGVAMGLVADDHGRHAILTDIEGMEDALGDMDFKVAGTSNGITALQLDLKIKGISYQILEEALERAREARLHILERMREGIAAPREALSPHAPRMFRMVIPQEKIGSVIGPGGRTIRSITAETGATIDVENDGTVIIGSSSEVGARKAVEMIKSLTREVEVGAIYTGKVTRLMNFGAFVEIAPGKEGLVHISELADHRVDTVEDVVKVGDEVTVMVIEVDRMGRVNLSRRAVFAAEGEGGLPVTPRPAAAPGPLGQGGAPRPQGGPPARRRPREGGSEGPRQGGPGEGGRPPGGPSGPPRRPGPGRFGR